MHFHHWHVAFLHSSSFIICLIWFLTQIFHRRKSEERKVSDFSNLRVGVIHNFVPHPVGAGGEVQVSLRDDHDETTSIAVDCHFAIVVLLILPVCVLIQHR